jgi:hypothetical protein
MIDKLGQEVQKGDCVAYAVHRRSSRAELKVGRVTHVEPSSVTLEVNDQRAVCIRSEVLILSDNSARLVNAGFGGS